LNFFLVNFFFFSGVKTFSNKNKNGESKGNEHEDK